MTKKHYTVPQTEWTEALNASSFLQQSSGDTKALDYEDLGGIWSE